jgi:hypothetical protein
MEEAVMTTAVRYLCRVDDNSLHAYASTRRDFHLASDDSLWAHESHGWLLGATTGARFAHRVGSIYYDAQTEAPVYFETNEPPA